jgi:hypothetical protein
MSKPSANPSSKSTKPIEEKRADSTYENWLQVLYDQVINKQDDYLIHIYEEVSYKGFNRSDVLKDLYSLNLDNDVMYQLIMVGALRGPQVSVDLKLINGKTPKSMGIPASVGKGNKGLSMSRIIAATADIAAYLLKRVNAPKRIPSELPGWLQFPSAGGIRMPDKYRLLHRDFSINFSKLIGGMFNEQIYFQMEQNSYCDPKLNLFI